MISYDAVIIGGGPAGLAAAISLKEKGIHNIIILERDRVLGGILNQCIHNGFGLHMFKEELTGPEYAQRYIDRVHELEIAYKLNTMVMNLSTDKLVTAMNSKEGIFEMETKAIILAMGCRERSRGALNIAGHRPAGIYSAGTAQRLVNIEGFMPGKEIVILGSGDIGLIMARRMILEGAQVKAVVELMPYSGGLKRNIVQCLDDFDIPLKLAHTIVDLKGKERLEGVVIAQVNEKGMPIASTEEYYTCDTLLLSCGLIPENELSIEMGIEIEPLTSGPSVNERLETNIEGVFACGNVLHVHDLVDFVSEEAELAGKNAARFINKIDNKKKNNRKYIPIIATQGVRYSVPQKIDLTNVKKNLTIRFRVGAVYKNVYISVYLGTDRIIHKKKSILAPGEMETIQIKKAQLEKKHKFSEIIIKIEEA